MFSDRKRNTAIESLRNIAAEHDEGALSELFGTTSPSGFWQINAADWLRYIETGSAPAGSMVAFLALSYVNAAPSDRYLTAGALGLSACLYLSAYGQTPTPEFDRFWGTLRTAVPELSRLMKEASDLLKAQNR